MEEDGIASRGPQRTVALEKKKKKKNLLVLVRRSPWPRGPRRWSWPLGYWDRVFESRSGHGCLSLCFCVVLSCVGRGLCDGLITRPKESYLASKSMIKKPQRRRPIPDLGCRAIGWMENLLVNLRYWRLTCVCFTYIYFAVFAWI
jgi:hypothetical protein